MTVEATARSPERFPARAPRVTGSTMSPAAFTARAMDGVLRPNRALDEARLVARAAAPDNLAWQDDHLLLSSGQEILVIGDVRDDEARPERILQFETPVSALASASDGTLAVGLGRGGVVLVGGAHDGLRLTSLGERPLICPTALAFAGPDMLFLCQGSAFHEPEAWQRDLLAQRPSGSVWRIDLAIGAAACLAENLAFPNGILPLEGGKRIAVSESWGHRLLAFEATHPAAPRLLLADLPGFPGRLCPAAAGAWLSVFAVKPWTPVRSYGLAVLLDRTFAPVASLHSPSSGHRHGVTSCLEVGGELFVACKLDDVLVAVETTED
jgi:hypothetical protein